jgi:hypothetical protein
LIEFCASNPPYFKTDTTLTDYSTIFGLQFPSLGQAIISMTLDAKGLRETRINVVLSKGDSRVYYLVSPFIYRLSFREQLLVYSLAKGIESY